VWAPGAIDYAQSISWLDGVKDDLKQALVSLGVVLHMLVVFSNYCLGFFVLSFHYSYICF